MDRRTVLAITLSISIFLAWLWFDGWYRSTKKRPAPRPAPAAKKNGGDAPKPAETPEKETKTPEPAGVDIPKYPERPPHVLSSPLLEVECTNRGAGISRLTLKYPEENGVVPLLAAHELRYPHGAIREVGGPEAVSLENAFWKVEEAGPRSITYSFVLPSGVRITKEFSIDPEKHSVNLVMWLERAAGKKPDGKEEPVPGTDLRLEFLFLNGLEHDTPYRYDYYANGVARANHEILPPWSLQGVAKAEKDLAAAKRSGTSEAVAEAEKRLVQPASHTEWVGLRNRFFAGIVIPGSSAQSVLDHYRFRSAPKEAVEQADGMKNLHLLARTQNIHVADQPVNLQFTSYFGPLDEDVLRREKVPGADELITYWTGCGSAAGGGCFLPDGCAGFLFGLLNLLTFPVKVLVNLVAPMVLGLLHFTGSLVGNYGFGIILTTLLIRVCLFPLSKKSHTSMARIQELSPKIKALKERYADNPQKLQQEQLRLYREEKINPAAGCLPMLIQLPIFISMFRVFEVSLELRQAPFIFWIDDLSQPDQLLGPWEPVSLIFGLTITSLNVLPIIMTITWFLQAWFSPKSPDPQQRQQQKMMMFMPVVFGFVCYGYASGLSLYFFVNSLLAIVEQKLIKKYFVKPAGAGEKKA